MQKISSPSEQMTRAIEAKRDWVRNHYTPEALSEYDTVGGKLALLDTILESNWIAKNDTLHLQCLGITLGDAFVQEMNFVWVQVEDEDGVDPAIQLPGTSIILYPLTMISKRVERGEEVDVYELFGGLMKKVYEIRDQQGPM